MATYTLVHVLISLAGIGSGLVVAFGLSNDRRLDGWTAVFLATTLATSLRAPTQSEPPFGIAQLAVAALFLALGFAVVRRFRNTSAAAERMSA